MGKDGSGRYMLPEDLTESKAGESTIIHDHEGTALVAHSVQVGRGEAELVRKQPEHDQTASRDGDESGVCQAGTKGGAQRVGQGSMQSANSMCHVGMILMQPPRPLLLVGHITQADANGQGLLASF